jgi:Na+-translocating ferredoxin:NAD+ oxidoreductase subunit G
MNLRKSEKTLVFILVLAVISALSASLISFVYSVTKPRIENIKKQALIDAANIVLPESDQVIQKTKTISSSGEKIEYFEGIKDSKTTGYAFTTENNKGYGGNIQILMGVDVKCNLTGFQIIQHAETPGLGDQADKAFFKEQFLGKGLDNLKFMVKQDGGDIDAITAATITSRAVTQALEDGLNKIKTVVVCK